MIVFSNLIDCFSLVLSCFVAEPNHAVIDGHKTDCTMGVQKWQHSLLIWKVHLRLQSNLDFKNQKLSKEDNILLMMAIGGNVGSVLDRSTISTVAGYALGGDHTSGSVSLASPAAVNLLITCRLTRLLEAGTLNLVECLCWGPQTGTSSLSSFQVHTVDNQAVCQKANCLVSILGPMMSFRCFNKRIWDFRLQNDRPFVI